MTNKLSRRGFIKMGATTAGILAVGQLLPPAVARAAIDAGLLNPAGDGYIPSMCEMCVWRCGLIAKVKEGRVVKLDGNPDHPHSRGHLCVRGQSGLMNTYDPDRVLTPLIRVGNTGGRPFPKSLLGRSAGLNRQQNAGNQRAVWARGDGLFVHA